MFFGKSYNALDELAFMYKSYDQKLEVVSRQTSEFSTKRIVRKTSISQFHYNALETLAQLYDIRHASTRRASLSPPSTRMRPLSIIEENCDEELSQGRWDLFYEEYDLDRQDDSAFESGDLTSEVQAPPPQRVQVPPSQCDQKKVNVDVTPQRVDTLKTDKLFLMSTAQQKSNYFDLSNESESKDGVAPLLDFGKVTSMDIDGLPDLPQLNTQLKRTHSNDHFIPTGLECFLEHLVTRGRIGNLAILHAKYARCSKSELQHLPETELYQIRKAVERFDPYTRKERMLLQRCLDELVVVLKNELGTL